MFTVRRVGEADAFAIDLPEIIDRTVPTDPQNPLERLAIVEKIVGLLLADADFLTQRKALRPLLAGIGLNLI